MSPAVQKFAALGILAVVALAAHRFAVLPLWNYHVELRDSLAQTRFQTAKLTASANRLSALEGQRDELAAALARWQPMFGQDKAGAAEAALQGKVKSLLNGSGGRLESARPVSAPAEDGIEMVALELVLRMPNDALQRLLHRLATTLPRPIMRELVIDASAARRGARARSEPLVRARMVLAVALTSAR